MVNNFFNFIVKSMCFFVWKGMPEAWARLLQHSGITLAETKRNPEVR